MATFTVNGQTVQAEKNQKLIRFLRDELRLTSVKDGCSEGACGTCHVLIDGKATKACIPSTDKLEGKTVLTVEGLSDWEKAVYTYAFGKAGAVQCGFCIPGMVISAKALLDVLDTPVSPELLPPTRNGEIAQKSEDSVGPYNLQDFFLYYLVDHGFAPEKVLRLADIAYGDEFDHATLKKWLRSYCRRLFSQQFKRSCLQDGPTLNGFSFSPRTGFSMPSDGSDALYLASVDALK